jgi:hypothetical protein
MAVGAGQHGDINRTTEDESMDATVRALEHRLRAEDA